MLRFGLFKQQKPRAFNLQPRYYNERKERLDKLKARYDSPKEGAEFDQNLYREHLRDSWSRKRLTSSQGPSLIRVVLILGVLVALIYYVFK